MRRTTPLALATAALLLAGCGTQRSAGSGGEAPAPPGGTPSAGRFAPCAGRVQLTAADRGRGVCVTRGGEIRITLDGTEARPWKPVTTSGTALKAVNAGFVLRPGDATAAYQAVAAGTVRLTSSRPPCANCGGGEEEWAVTVRVA